MWVRNVWHILLDLVITHLLLVRVIGKGLSTDRLVIIHARFGILVDRLISLIQEGLSIAKKPV